MSLTFVFAVPFAVARPEKMRAIMKMVVKRSLDVVGALVGLLLTSPLFFLVPLLIKLETPGPAFYTQTRVGVNRRRGDRRYCQRLGVNDTRASERRRHNCLGKPFKVVKFRTMVVDAEKKCGPVWATKDDPRI
ncbi:MAG TPA: sugar transferase, partial [Candidatus Deferrimicrobium sp.]|nr:sugar transferase [Candidatus Deferrimicrobium sp.]